jgi:3-dehydroquinate synthase
MQKLHVPIKGAPYSITINTWDDKHLASTLSAHIKDDRLFIITNPKLKRLYAKRLEKALPKGVTLCWLLMPEGEKYKTLATCEKLHVALSKNGASRQSLILAFGGGVVGDVAGFVAATYMRGIACIQMPTSLLAMVDSSVGGKTGVDLPTGKNLVGAFFQPKAVIIFTDVLKTLPARELHCGLAEVIKYGCICDKPFFKFLEAHAQQILAGDPKVIASVILRCCAIKAQVVGADEKETGLRAILNFGHTLGHAIEALTGFDQIKHGEAIAMGMVFAAKLSHNLGFSSVDESPEIIRLLKAFKLPTAWPKYTASAYASAMSKDKKATGQSVKFVLLKKIGRVTIVPLLTKELVKCL